MNVQSYNDKLHPARDLQVFDSNDAVDRDYRQHTPGTEILLDEKSGDSEIHFRLHNLQHASTNSNIILVPQPSLTDINDPLRWPRWKKLLVFANVLDYSFNGSITGPIMAAGYFPPLIFESTKANPFLRIGMIEIADRYGVTLQKMTYANTATLLCQGVGNIFWMFVSILYSCF
jgi:hypothetical protein